MPKTLFYKICHFYNRKGNEYVTKLSSDFVQNFLLQAKHPLISSHFNRLNSVKKKTNSLVRLPSSQSCSLGASWTPSPSPHSPLHNQPKPNKKMYQDKLKQIRRDSNQNWPEKLQLSKIKMLTLQVEFVLPLPPGQVVLLRHLLPKLRPRPRRHRLQNPNLRDQVCRQWAL